MIVDPTQTILCHILNMKVGLLETVVTTQILLWLSYFIFFKTTRTELQSLWGNVPSKLHTPLLGFATISYLMNIGLLVHLARASDVSREEELILIICVLVYYLPQLLFLPMTDQSVNGKLSKAYVTALLVLCVMPFVVIAGVVVRYSVQKNTEGMFYKMFSAIVPLLHVLINDAILYGFLF